MVLCPYFAPPPIHTRLGASPGLGFTPIYTLGPTQCPEAAEERKEGLQVGWVLKDGLGLTLCTWGGMVWGDQYPHKAREL